MAKFYDEPCHTFNEYLLIPGYTSPECVPANVDLSTPLCKFKKGEKPIKLNIPMISAIMQSVSNDTLAIALAKEGGMSFIYGSQSIEDEARMVARVKNYKAGFVVSASNLTPENTLADVIDLKERNGFSTIAITDDGSCNGKLLGIVTSRDYRVSRMNLEDKVADFMTPLEKLITAPAKTSLKEANDIIWEHKLNSLPIVDDKGNLMYFVFRKDYAEHKINPREILDEEKRYMVGAGINTLDYETRVPALVEAGADVLCIDSSEGYTCWQKKTIEFIREKYGDKVKVGAGNVVDKDGFLFLAEAGADFVMLGRYFARFDESPTPKLNINGTYVKEYWGEGSNRARNWQRYDLGGKNKLAFEEGVDSYVTYAGPLHDNVEKTLYKIKSTMCNCGVTNIPDLQKNAKLTLVSQTSIVEGGYHDVILKGGNTKI